MYPWFVLEVSRRKITKLLYRKIQGSAIAPKGFQSPQPGV